MPTSRHSSSNCSAFTKHFDFRHPGLGSVQNGRWCAAHHNLGFRQAKSIQVDGTLFRAPSPRFADSPLGRRHSGLGRRGHERAFDFFISIQLFYIHSSALIRFNTDYLRFCKWLPGTALEDPESYRSYLPEIICTLNSKSMLRQYASMEDASSSLLRRSGTLNLQPLTILFTF
jgi:hypothetical protein